MPPQSDNKIVIRQGEKVYILKTPKGCYLRTQDKKYIALRNKSIEEKFMISNGLMPEKHQTPTNYTNNQIENFSLEFNDKNINNGQLQDQIDFSSNVFPASQLN